MASTDEVEPQEFPPAPHIAGMDFESVSSKVAKVEGKVERVESALDTGGSYLRILDPEQLLDEKRALERQLCDLRQLQLRLLPPIQHAVLRGNMHLGHGSQQIQDQWVQRSYAGSLPNTTQQPKVFNGDGLPVTMEQRPLIHHSHHSISDVGARLKEDGVVTDDNKQTSWGNRKGLVGQLSHRCPPENSLVSYSERPNAISKVHAFSVGTDVARSPSNDACSDVGVSGRRPVGNSAAADATLAAHQTQQELVQSLSASLVERPPKGIRLNYKGPVIRHIIALACFRHKVWDMKRGLKCETWKAVLEAVNSMPEMKEIGCCSLQALKNCYSHMKDEMRGINGVVGWRTRADNTKTIEDWMPIIVDCLHAEENLLAKEQQAKGPKIMVVRSVEASRRGLAGGVRAGQEGMVIENTCDAEAEEVGFRTAKLDSSMRVEANEGGHCSAGIEVKGKGKAMGSNSGSGGETGQHIEQAVAPFRGLSEKLSGGDDSVSTVVLEDQRGLKRGAPASASASAAAAAGEAAVRAIKPLYHTGGIRKGDHRKTSSVGSPVGIGILSTGPRT
ncbi:unnamed protein product [Choristocarpus tenellus]